MRGVLTVVVVALAGCGAPVDVKTGELQDAGADPRGMTGAGCRPDGTCDPGLACVTGRCQAQGCSSSAQCDAATETCDTSAHACVCLSGHHRCGGACVSDTSTASCGASCTACSTPANATATCTGGTCGFSCAAGYRLRGGQCVRMHVFVTSGVYDGKLGGLSGADAKCALAAQSVNLGGTYVAWLSSSTADAIDRITDVGPWVDLTGQVVFNNKAMVTLAPLTAVGTSEQGTSVGGSQYVWTGTNTGGRHAADHCYDWTANYNSQAIVGSVYQTTGWTDSGYQSCGVQHHLYCFEQ